MHIQPLALATGRPSTAWPSSLCAVDALGRAGPRERTPDSEDAGRLRETASDGWDGAGRRSCFALMTGELVGLLDPYLICVNFANAEEVAEKNGSSGRTRTYNPPVNSRMLCH